MNPVYILFTVTSGSLWLGWLSATGPVALCNWLGATKSGLFAPSVWQVKTITNEKSVSRKFRTGFNRAGCALIRRLAQVMPAND